METTELFYPEIAVQLGGYQLKQGIEIEAVSNKNSYFDWAKIRFTEKFRDKISVSKKDEAVIRLGYNGTYYTVFNGYFTKPYNQSAYGDEILLKDAMLSLEETYVTNTFLSVTPQEIISYGLTQAGIADQVLTDQVYQPLSCLSVSKRNVIDLIGQVHHAFGINCPFYFRDKTFYWGEKPEQDKIYQFDYGVNIISFARSGGVWQMETVSAPFIHHSDQIRINHPALSGTYEVQKVTFTTNETGFIRTVIEFR